MSIIAGNFVGMYSTLGKTLILTDENGNELTGVITENSQVFDVKPSDVKINKIFAGEEGIQVGENTIVYRTEMASYLIDPGKTCSIPLEAYNMYDYTKVQCIIVSFSVDYESSVETIGVSVGDHIFSATSFNKLSDITKNSTTNSIDLNITNNSDNIYEIFYFTYHEDMED